jgi:hypothetical protein
MNLPKIITKEWLQEKKACAPSIAIFNELFPNGCDLTIENALIAVKRGLNLNWLARVLFNESWTYQAYDKKAAEKLINLIEKA